METAAQAQPKTRAHGTIRVSLPARIAYHPESLKKTIGGLLEELGCPKCFSGANCLFSLERDLVVDPEGELHAATRESSPNPWPWKADQTAVVSVAPGARFNIDTVFKAVDNVIHTLGACPCHSGFDVLYWNELTVIGVNAQGQAQQFGGQTAGL